MYAEDAYPDMVPVDSPWDLARDEWKGCGVMIDPLQRGGDLVLKTEIVLRSDDVEAVYESEFGEAIELGGGIDAGKKFLPICSPTT